MEKKERKIDAIIAIGDSHALGSWKTTRMLPLTVRKFNYFENAAGALNDNRHITAHIDVKKTST